MNKKESNGNMLEGNVDGRESHGEIFGEARQLWE